MKKTGPLELLLLFAIPGLLLALAVRVAVPLLAEHTSLRLEACWFLSAGVLVLLPMMLAAISLSGREIGSFHVSRLGDRMRIKRMRGMDWAWALGAIAVVGVLTGVMLKLGSFIPGFDPHPEFFPNMPLKSGMWWLIPAWFPFFFLNIVGEELWWRGYVQPRQELLTASPTWLIHGLLWGAFHVGMGSSAIR